MTKRRTPSPPGRAHAPAPRPLEMPAPERAQGTPKDVVRKSANKAAELAQRKGLGKGHRRQENPSKGALYKRKQRERKAALKDPEKVVA